MQLDTMNQWPWTSAVHVQDYANLLSFSPKHWWKTSTVQKLIRRKVTSFKRRVLVNHYDPPDRHFPMLHNLLWTLRKKTDVSTIIQSKAHTDNFHCKLCFAGSVTFIPGSVDKNSKRKYTHVCEECQRDILDWQREWLAIQKMIEEDQKACTEYVIGDTLWYENFTFSLRRNITRNAGFMQRVR
jgi:hypothetical protein